MPEDRVREALRGALMVRRPLAGLIIHSDQDSQYRATRFKTNRTYALVGNRAGMSGWASNWRR